MTTETLKCVHWWILGDTANGLTIGVCKKCGAEKTYGEIANPNSTDRPTKPIIFNPQINNNDKPIVIPIVSIEKHEELKKQSPPIVNITDEMTKLLPKVKIVHSDIIKPKKQHWNTPDYFCIECGIKIKPRNYRVDKGEGNYCKSCFNKLFPPPIRKYKRNEPYKRGHYNKSSTKINSVIEYYNRGLGFRQVAKLLNMSTNTVRSIVAEYRHTKIDLDKAKLARMKVYTEKHSGLIFAIKGLVSSGRNYNYSLETLFDKGVKLLQQYLETDAKETIIALVGNNTFTPDDLIKKIYELVLAQYLRLSHEFEEVSEGVFKIKE